MFLVQAIYQFGPQCSWWSRRISEKPKCQRIHQTIVVKIKGFDSIPASYQGHETQMIAWNQLRCMRYYDFENWHLMFQLALLCRMLVVYFWCVCLQYQRVRMINSLRPSDTICGHRAGSTLAQVMACCLTAPSHYLNQYWLIVIPKIFWHSCDGNFTVNVPDIYAWYKFEND